MAERRMFAKSIIDSDAFLSMPMSAQCLYFHLSMRADDEGFVGNPRGIQRLVGASDDDGKILLSKRFILAFDSGVIVIKHWKIHNYIRGDRINETTYLEEKAMLTLDGKNAYTEVEKDDDIFVADTCQSDVSQVTANCPHRLGKDSIDKVSIGKDSIDIGADPKPAKSKPSKLTVDYAWIVSKFNDICTSLPQVRQLTEQRKQKLKRMDDEHVDFESYWKLVEASDFLCGRTETKWKASFDWLLEPRNVVKVLEGNYANKTQSAKKGGFSGQSSFDPDEFLNAAVNRKG